MSNKDLTQWPAGVNRIILESIGSTMTEAARRAPTITAPTWIMAHVQTDGRGRLGRSWLTPSGNLTATLIYSPQGTLMQASQRSFVASLALFDALAHFVPAAQLALKWPNDVLLNGGKVAGILLETSAHRDELFHLSVGIGVNLQHAPDVPDAAFAPTSLRAAGADVSAEDFLAILANTYATHEAALVDHGFDRIRREWLVHAARLGEVITARTTQAEITGTFQTIDETGNLVLLTEAGPKIIPAADVYF